MSTICQDSAGEEHILLEGRISATTIGIAELQTTLGGWAERCASWLTALTMVLLLLLPALGITLGASHIFEATHATLLLACPPLHGEIAVHQRGAWIATLNERIQCVHLNPGKYDLRLIEFDAAAPRTRPCTRTITIAAGQQHWVSPD